jgi:TIR domain
MSRKPEARPSEVFLCHSSKNAAFTRRLAMILTAHGVASFLSKENIRGAQAWHDELGAALGRCDWFLVVLSPHSVKSKWVKYGLVYALQQKRYEGRIIPLLRRTCNIVALSWTLPALQSVDFRKDFQQGCKDLLAIWGLRNESDLGG